MAAAWHAPAAPVAAPGSVEPEQPSAARPAPIQIPHSGQSTATENGDEASGSPQRPPVSPITPVASFALLAHQNPIKPPPAHPSSATASGSTNSAPNEASRPYMNPSPASTQPSNSTNSTPFTKQTSFSADMSSQQQTPRSFVQTPLSQPQSAQAHIQTRESPDTAPPINYTAHPVPVSIPESENTDAQALRAALAVLQIQRDKSTRDIKTLTTLKEAAAHDPQRFVDDMLAGKLGHKQLPGAVSDPLRPTLEEDYSDDDEDDDDDQDDDDSNDRDGDDKMGQDAKNKKLPKFPTRQNIVRCPPVNWAKYHVLGESLDKLHEEQRRRPTLGEPASLGVGGEWQGRDHVIAAPYSPWADGLQHPMQTRRGSKKPL